MLNNKGKLSCAQADGKANSTFKTTFCKFDGPRRVKILTNAVMTNATTTGYDFRIYDVAQPKTLDSFKKIYLGIEKADESTVLYQTNALADTALKTAEALIIPVTNVAITGNSIR